MFWVGDPVATGFAARLAKPGGRATGVSVLSTELNRKRLELLAVAPGAKVVGYLTNASSPLMVLDQILRGAAPREVPIQQPTTFVLSVNRKTAKALGIKIPESIMLRADEVIR